MVLRSPPKNGRLGSIGCYLDRQGAFTHMIHFNFLRFLGYFFKNDISFLKRIFLSRISFIFFLYSGIFAWVSRYGGIFSEGSLKENNFVQLHGCFLPKNMNHIILK